MPRASGAHGGGDDWQGARRQGIAKLIRQDDTAVYGDKGYASDEKKRAVQEAGVLWAVKEKAKPGRALTMGALERHFQLSELQRDLETQLLDRPRDSL